MEGATRRLFFRQPHQGFHVMAESESFAVIITAGYLVMSILALIIVYVLSGRYERNSWAWLISAIVAGPLVTLAVLILIGERK